MNVETNLYENVINSGKAMVITKDCFLRGRSYTKTDIYVNHGTAINSDYRLVETVQHYTYDLHKLKRLHDQIVNEKTDYNRVGSYQQMGI